MQRTRRLEPRPTELGGQPDNALPADTISARCGARLAGCASSHPPSPSPLRAAVPLVGLTCGFAAGERRSYALVPGLQRAGIGVRAALASRVCAWPRHCPDRLWHLPDGDMFRGTVSSAKRRLAAHFGAIRTGNFSAAIWPNGPHRTAACSPSCRDSVTVGGQCRTNDGARKSASPALWQGSAERSGHPVPCRRLPLPACLNSGCCTNCGTA